ncbi:tectonin domain-containing protein [Methylocaldum gracile]|jgi:hypothetical protein
MPAPSKRTIKLVSVLAVLVLTVLLGTVRAVDERVWYPRSVIDTTESGQVSFPQLRDVAKQLDTGATDVWLIAKDGTLWRHGGGPWPPRIAGQVASPGGLARVDVAYDGTVWCITSSGFLWHRRNDETWKQVPQNLAGPLVDVTVFNGTVWVARADGSVWMTRNGIDFEDRSALIGFKRLAGNNRSQMWGIANYGALWWRGNVGTPDEAWFPAEGIGSEMQWEDVSVSHDGTAWLVAADGTVWFTTDGIGYQKIPGEGFSSISAGRYLDHWAVKADGTLWAWQPSEAPPPAAPPPPPPPQSPSPPPPSQPEPNLGVSTTGAGLETAFHVTGSGFLPNTQTTIRGVRIGQDEISEYYWTTTANADGEIAADLPIPCLSGIIINFSANDGRPDPNDLTNRFWSNTVPASCP